MDSFNLIAGIVAFIVALILNVRRHYDAWYKVISSPDAGSQVAINHKKETIIRAFWVMPSIVFLWLAKSASLFHLVPAIVCVAAVWWLLFDGLFNLARGFSWWFGGTVDKDESVFDDIKRKLGVKGMKIVQVGVAIAGVAFYILTK